MLARVRHRLSYANVVATLALFVALGGTGYAASQLTGRDIKNRSISRVDVKKNTLTGTEINESKLKQVPRAKTATNATNAINANSALAADVSKNSQSADSAAVAAIANDARALAGQGAASFEKSSRIAFGKAPANPAGTSGEQVVLSWPEMGVELTSASPGAPACGSDEIRLGLRNTKASGPSAFLFQQGDPDAKGTAPPGGVVRSCTVVGSGQVTDSTGRTLFIDCRVVATELRCLGVRSEP